MLVIDAGLKVYMHKSLFTDSEAKLRAEFNDL